MALEPPSEPVFNVFFRPGSAALTPNTEKTVDSAAISIAQDHPRSVVISAGATPGDDLQYAEARFQVVQTTLVAKGVNPAVIVRATLPESPIKLDATADRRVEIKLLDIRP
jgi:outer membrane protein OmpA-like peptidoglycan-associated protein